MRKFKIKLGAVALTIAIALIIAGCSRGAEGTAPVTPITPERGTGPGSSESAPEPPDDAPGSSAARPTPPPTPAGTPTPEPPDAAPGSPTTIPTHMPTPRPRSPRAGEFRQLIPRDGIRPIYDPSFVPAAGADLSPDELVIGVSLNGDNRAYPIGPLRRREIVNDTVGGTPILVTW